MRDRAENEVLTEHWETPEEEKDKREIKTSGTHAYRDP